MANLVSPGYKETKLINSILAANEERIIEFKGLNRRDYVEEGEMSDMQNLTSDNYPLLTPRKLRGTYPLPTGVVIPLKIMARYNKICLIAKDSNDDVNFYFDGTKVAEINDLTEDSEMVAINTKICFFPQKTCISILQSGSTVQVITGSYTSLEASVTIAAANKVDVTISNTDARMTLSGDYDFSYDDAINLEGNLIYQASGDNTDITISCIASCIIEEVIKTTSPATTTLVLPRETFIELTGEGAHDIKFYSFTVGGDDEPCITRTMPDLDMVIEWNNRLWGANSIDNTIYACKLGDPKNWQYYQGTSLDSYYAQQGTDGVWTGCAAYSSHIIFFKQNGMARIYGSAPSNYQITNTKCYGVEEGSRGSVVTINDKVFYKSVIGIMAYDGGTPYCVSEKFNYPFKYVVGGSEGRKYYASIQTENIGPELMVLDIDRGVWHKEDSSYTIGEEKHPSKFKSTCSIDDKLYFITHDSEGLTCGNDVYPDPYLLCGAGEPTEGEISIINPYTPTEIYEDMDWSATFGPFDEYIENRKIYSKLMLRLLRKKESWVKVYISIDEGDWEKVYEFDPASTGGDYIPIIPRRCDRYSVKIEGQGDCCIKSLTRNVRRGTGGRL